MDNEKSNATVKTDTNDEQIISAVLKSKPKRVELGLDADGNIFVDKKQHPDVYNWASEDGEAH